MSRPFNVQQEEYKKDMKDVALEISADRNKITNDVDYVRNGAI